MAIILCKNDILLHYNYPAGPSSSLTDKQWRFCLRWARKYPTENMNIIFFCPYFPFIGTLKRDDE